MKRFFPKALFTLSALFLFCSAISLSSCTKTNTVTKTVTDTVTVTNTVIDTLVVAPHSIMDYLTQKEWYYDTAIINYTGPGTGSLYYARHGGPNVENFDSLRYVFWRNGTEDVFVDMGRTWYSQTWQFTGSDSTAIYYGPVSERPTAVTQTILQLDSSDLVIYESDNVYKHMTTHP